MPMIMGILNAEKIAYSNHSTNPIPGKPYYAFKKNTGTNQVKIPRMHAESAAAGG